MLRMGLAMAAALMLAGCGYSETDRAISGGGIGAGTGLIFGPVGVVTGAAVGVATGALTDHSDFDLGRPLWRR